MQQIFTFESWNNHMFDIFCLMNYLNNYSTIKIAKDLSVLFICVVRQLTDFQLTVSD